MVSRRFSNRAKVACIDQPDLRGVIRGILLGRYGIIVFDIQNIFIIAGHMG